MTTKTTDGENCIDDDPMCDGPDGDRLPCFVCYLYARDAAVATDADALVECEGCGRVGLAERIDVCPCASSDADREGRRA